MEEMDHTVKEALETVLGFEGSLNDLETRTGELFHLFEQKHLDPEPLYQIFRVFSEIRFHMAEADEYQTLLEIKLRSLGAQKKKLGSRRTPPQEQPWNPPLAPPPAPAKQPAGKGLEGGMVSLLLTP